MIAWLSAQMQRLFDLPNLLDEQAVTEVHIVFPQFGTPKMFAAKLDNPSEPVIMQMIQGIIESGLAFGRMYNMTVAGNIGMPPTAPPPTPPAK